MYVCMYVCMYPCTSPLLPSISRKKTRFFQRFRKRTSKNIEFFQIFGKRMQEAQASKKAGRGNRAWDPCFATPASRRLRLVERHQIAARYVGDPPPLPPPPPPKKTYVLDVGRGWVRGGVILYPLVSIRHAEQCRRIFSQLQSTNTDKHEHLQKESLEGGSSGAVFVVWLCVLSRSPLFDSVAIQGPMFSRGGSSCVLLQLEPALATSKLILLACKLKVRPVVLVAGNLNCMYQR